MKEVTDVHPLRHLLLRLLGWRKDFSLFSWLKPCMLIVPMVYISPFYRQSRHTICDMSKDRRGSWQIRTSWIRASVSKWVEWALQVPNFCCRIMTGNWDECFTKRLEEIVLTFSLYVIWFYTTNGMCRKKCSWKEIYLVEFGLISENKPLAGC